MADLDALRVKILELKRKRDDLGSQVAKDKSDITGYDEQIAELERQKSKVKIAADEKESQVRKLDDLIRQSETAVNKMMQNTQKLSEALSMALEEGL